MRDVNDEGIEGTTDPCQRFGMLFVVRIGDRFEVRGDNQEGRRVASFGDVPEW